MQHPNPRLPAHPVLTSQSFQGRGQNSFPSILDVGPALRFTSGRYGLATAMMLSGVDRSMEVLLPAYSCPAMVSPIRWLGADPVYYRVHPDLSIDVEDLSRRVNPKTRCVIAVHYFGWIQDLASLRRFCDERNLVLIEDCAHTLYGGTRERPVGSVGDFAFASLMKFFPLYDGGCLVSARGFDRRPTTRRGGWGYQFKALVNILERSHAYGRLPWRTLWDVAFSAKNLLLTAAKLVRGAGSVVAAPGSVDGGYEFEGDWMGVEMSLSSAALLRFLSVQRCVEGRRANYLRLLRNLDALSGGRALYPELPATMVPYVFPLYVDDPEAVFLSLKQRGVPLLRWEDAETTTCHVSASYSRRLLLVPCHQELRVQDLDWISAQIREAFASHGR